MVKRHPGGLLNMGGTVLAGKGNNALHAAMPLPTFTLKELFTELSRKRPDRRRLSQ